MRPKLRGFWLFTPVGLPPTEHVYLSWTHCLAKTKSAFEMNDMRGGRVTRYMGPAGAVMGQTRFSVGRAGRSVEVEEPAMK